LFQGLKELRLKNWQNLPVDPSTIDTLILTHAHLDHCGYIPLLVKQGFKGRIYCSEPTLDLAHILLLDSAKIQEEDAAQANKMGYSKHKPAKPLYNTEDVERCFHQFASMECDEWFPLWRGVRFRFIPSGHIVGSVFVEIEVNGLKIVFSGDLGRNEPLVLHPRRTISYAHYLVGIKVSAATVKLLAWAFYKTKFLG
jgi:metallo-beta-lactamase family protein